MISLTAVHHDQTVASSIQQACNKLGLNLPVPTLIKLLETDGKIKSVVTASGVFCEVINGEACVLMIKQKWKNGTCDFPGGFRAGAPEDKWSKPSQEMTEAEQFFPLLTAAREVHEEVTFLFNQVKDSYDFLNKQETQVLTNSGWDRYPVVMYVHPLNEKLSQQVSEALVGEYKYVNDEVIGISRIGIRALREAFKENGWSADGLKARAELLDNAKLSGTKADLKDFAQYQRNLSVKDLSGNAITISDYTARSIFPSLDAIEGCVNKFFGAKF